MKTQQPKTCRDTIKAVLRRKFIAIQAYLKKQEKSQINNTLLIFEKALRNQHISFKWNTCVISEQIFQDLGSRGEYFKESINGIYWNHRKVITDKGGYVFECCLLSSMMLTKEEVFNKWYKQCQFIRIFFVSIKRLKF